MQLARWIVVTAHVLVGGAWFGAMLYSLVVLHPRAQSFFRSSKQFEEFIARRRRCPLEGPERGRLRSPDGYRLATHAQHRTELQTNQRLHCH